MNYFSENRLIIVTQEDIDEGNIPGINDLPDEFHDGENLWLMNEVMDGPEFNLLCVSDTGHQRWCHNRLSI